MNDIVGLPENERVKVDLTSIDGNAFVIMGAVRKALRRAGQPSDVIDRFIKEATAGDYDHLLQVVLAYTK